MRKACKRYADEFLRDPKEHDTRGPHTVHVPQAKGASVASEEQEGDSDVETALAALAGESDIDLEETDVQEILLAHKESRLLRGEQRVNRGYRPVTGDTSGGKPYRVEGRRQRADLTLTLPLSFARRDTGRVNVQTKENKCPGTVKR